MPGAGRSKRDVAPVFEGATALNDVLTASGGNYVVGMALSQGPASAGEYVGFQGNNYTCP